MYCCSYLIISIDNAIMHLTTSNTFECKLSPLLVNFPTQPRSKCSGKKNNTHWHQHDDASTSNHLSRVCFSDKCDVAIYHTEEVHASKTWYTSSDISPMNQEFINSVLCTRKMINAVRVDDNRSVTDDELIGCIGIEHLLSSERARRRHNHRREHAQNVLAKQDSCTVEELCQVSMHSSKSSRNKAYCLAVSNHKIGR